MVTKQKGRDQRWLGKSSYRTVVRKILSLFFSFFGLSELNSYEESFCLEANLQSEFMLSSVTGSAVTERPKAAPIPTVNPEGKLIKKGKFLLACPSPAADGSQQCLTAEGRGWRFQEGALKFPRQQQYSLSLLLSWNFLFPQESTIVLST